MHDTLQYMERDSIHRSYHHDELTFGLHLCVLGKIYPAAFAR